MRDRDDEFTQDRPASTRVVTIARSVWIAIVVAIGLPALLAPPATLSTQPARPAAVERAPSVDVPSESAPVEAAPAPEKDASNSQPRRVRQRRSDPAR
jgi:hypothetical protein